jgi:hypothetical protein
VGIETAFVPLDEAYVSSLELAEQLPGWRSIAEERMDAICQGGELAKGWSTC